MQISLPKSINYVLDTLHKAGFKAYIVGGCVRDILCEKTPNDFDITTSALPENIKKLFSKTVETGIKHGTVTVIVDGAQIEVTTFRTEGKYIDHRRPESVEFVSDVKYDLSRRDFTVNAMCYNHEEGLIDLFGGRDDIKNRCLRAVGDPILRFNEDALRILRLVRFAATLGFTPDANTLNAAKLCRGGLKSVSAERIFSELKKAASGNNFTPLNEIISCGTLEHLGIVNPIDNNFKHLEPLEDLRLFAFLNQISSDLPYTLKSLKCSNKFYNYCTLLNEITVPDTRYEIKKILNRAGYDILCDYARLTGLTDKLIHIADDIIAKGEAYKLSHLKLNGQDIAKHGICGEEIGKRLEYLLDLVMQKPELNTRDSLIELI